MTYGKRTLIAVDQLLNTLRGGWPDETLSSRRYRWARDGGEGLAPARGGRAALLARGNIASAVTGANGRPQAIAGIAVRTTGSATGIEFSAETRYTTIALPTENQ